MFNYMASSRSSKTSKLRSSFVALLMISVSFFMVLQFEKVISLERDDIVLELRFNEGSGQLATDTSGNGWDGTLGLDTDEGERDPSWGQGINGTCLEFDGVKSLVMIDPFDMPQIEFTIAFWMKTGDDDSMVIPFSYAVPDEDNEVLIYMDDEITIEIDYPNSFTVGRDLRDGDWHHLAFTWASSNGTIDCYIDGLLEKSGTASEGLSVTPGGSLVIGYEQDEVGGGFQDNQGFMGSLDELVITDSYLDGVEIRSIYSEYMAPVRGLEITPGSGFLDLSWEPVNIPDLDHYNIYRVDPAKVENGLLGRYYNNENLTDLIGQRNDDEIDFDWGTEAPMTGVDPESFSISWNGYLKIDRETSYDFYTVSDDGARLWVSGDLLIDDWSTHGETEDQGTKELERGYHPVRLDYLDHASDAHVRLDMDGPGFPRMLIRSTSLFNFDLSDMQLIGTSSTTNFRDTSLETGKSYFYQISYSTTGGHEGPVSEIEGGSPSVLSTFRISPNEVDATVGEVIEFDVVIGNDARKTDWFELSVSEPYADWITFEQNEYYIEPGRREYLEMEMAIPLDSTEGQIRIDLVLVSELNEVNQLSSVWVDISMDPEILDLKPDNDQRLGSTDIIVSWETAISATSQVFVKETDASSYVEFFGMNGTHHVVNVTGLSRKTAYEYYVLTTTSYGSAQSEIRRFSIDNGVKFKFFQMETSIERDYGQMVSVQVINTDDVLHNVILTVDNPYDDLVAGFIGYGSNDKSLPVSPGTTSIVKLALHAQDAMDAEHRLYLNLTTVPVDGEEPLRSHAIMTVKLNHVFVNLTVTEISTDPYTLTKRIGITNEDDTVTDLRIYPEERFESYLNMEPMVQHGMLATGGSIEVDISPHLTFSFVSFTTTIFISAYDKTYSIDLDFTPPEDWEIFCASLFPNWGGYPFVEIPPDDMDIDGIIDAEDDDIDGDGIPNAEEPMFMRDTDNDHYENSIEYDDDGDGNPDDSDPWRIDFDNDWIPNHVDDDRDGDGVPNQDDTYPDDLDNDGVNNGVDTDDDNDRIPDSEDYHPQDHDNDGKNDDVDPDDDADGIADASDSHPYDEDNDGTADVDDSDWKGGGEADPASSKWNPNPSPGGSPGSYGGGGGSDSAEGDDWYCTNKPELDMAALLLFGFKLTMIIVGLITGLAGVATAAASMWGLVSIVGSFIADQAKDAAWSGIEDMTGFSYSNFEYSVAQTLVDGAKVLFGSRSVSPTRTPQEAQRYWGVDETDTSGLPVTVLNRNGLYNFWQEEVEGYIQIFYSHPEGNIINQAEEIMLTNTSVDSVDPFVYTNSWGKMYLVYGENSGVDGKLMLRTLDTDGEWSDPKVVSSSSGSVHDPQFWMDSRGRYHFVWMDSRYGDYEIMYLNVDNFISFPPPTRFMDSPSNSMHPQIGIGESDDVHIVWSDSNGTSREIFHIMSDDRGDSWGTVEQISDSGAGAGEPTLAITNSNIIHVAWRDSRHGESEIYYRKSLDSASTWEDEVRLTNDASYSELPDLIVYEENVMLLWHDDRTNMDLVYFKVYNSTRDEWSSTKRMPSGIPSIDSLFFEVKFTPKNEDGEVKPHDIDLTLDDVVISRLRNVVPDGKYLFEIPLEVLAASAGAGKTGKLKLITRHMNPGHYTVAANWKITWHYTYDDTYLFAPDQYTADMYLRNNRSEQWPTEDPAIYANDIHLSEKMPELNETISVSATVRNLGGDVAKDVEVRFYEQEPGNASRQIGETIVIDAIAPHANKTVSINWQASRDTSRIYVVIDEDEKINEMVETNNMEFSRLTVLILEPPTCQILINNGDPYTARSSLEISFDIESVNEVTYVSFSNDNASWSDWEPINTLVRWDLDDDVITRAGATDGNERTVYCRIKDLAGLESEIISSSIEYYPDIPTVLNTSMDDGEVGVGSPLWIEFSNPMDHDSVRGAFSIEPGIDGSFSWINSTLYFSPSGGFVADTVYNVTIYKDVLDFDGRGMELDLNWSFIALEGIVDDDDDPSGNDTDGDGIPDWWEDLHGLNKTDPNDASMDPDNDGLTNLEEFHNDTDPYVPDSPDDDDDDDDEREINRNFTWCIVLLVVLAILITLVVVVVIASRKGEEEDWED